MKRFVLDQTLLDNLSKTDDPKEITRLVGLTKSDFTELSKSDRAELSEVMGVSLERLERGLLSPAARASKARTTKGRPIPPVERTTKRALFRLNEIVLPSLAQVPRQLVVVLRPTLNVEAVRNVMSGCARQIRQFGFTVTEQTEPSKQPLVFPMGVYDTGWFVTFRMVGPDRNDLWGNLRDAIRDTDNRIIQALLIKSMGYPKAPHRKQPIGVGFSTVIPDLPALGMFSTGKVVRRDGIPTIVFGGTAPAEDHIIMKKRMFQKKDGLEMVVIEGMVPVKARIQTSGPKLDDLLIIRTEKTFEIKKWD